MIKVKSGQYTFYINGRQVFVRHNTGLNGNCMVVNRDDLDLTAYEYASLVDDIYNQRIRTIDNLIDNIYGFYKLVPTSRKLE